MASGGRFLVLLVLLGACGHAPPPADSSASAQQAEPKPQAGGAAPLLDAAPETAPIVAAEAGPPPVASAARASAPVFDTEGTTYPAASLREVFEKNQPKLLACLEPGRKRDPKLRGHVNIKFSIHHDGKAGAVQDQGSNLPDPQVIACVIKLVKTLRFAKPEGDVTVVYPFIFHSSEPFVILPDSAAPASPAVP
jgi:hypothetical protein